MTKALDHKQTIHGFQRRNERLTAANTELRRLLVEAKDELVRTGDLSMHSPTVALIERIARATGQPTVNSRAVVGNAPRRA
ncbi:MAG: hypothetical protein DI537_23945 [Stutzerimonas stutzeri]|nr:MAG: hypothetical protein DI537_23945 [Stutzerimonas stutzeri]